MLASTTSAYAPEQADIAKQWDIRRCYQRENRGNDPGRGCWDRRQAEAVLLARLVVPSCGYTDAVVSPDALQDALREI